MSAADWDASPGGLLALDQDGTVTAANAQVLAWTGRSAADVVGRVRLTDLLSVGGRLYWETHLAPRLELEGRLDEVTLELRGPTGRVPVLLSAALDRTDRRIQVALHGARERTRFERDLRAARELAELSATRLGALQVVTAQLSRATEVQAVADALLDVATGPLGATGAAVWTLTEGELRLQASRGPAPAPPRAVTGRAGAPAPWPSREPVQVALHGATGLQGVLTLAGHAPAAPVPDPSLLTAVAQQAGLALDRARLQEQGAGVARVLQRSMLTEPVQPDGLELVARYLPAATGVEVGGDWYDAFPGPDGATWLVVGDVAGHDIAAAAIMGQVRNLLRGIAYTQQRSPAAVLTAVDQAMAGLGVRSLATAVVVRVEPDAARAGACRVRWSNAGHPPPVLLPHRGAPTPLTTAPELVLGADPDSARTDHEHDLHPGDALLLYTDGLTERRSADLDSGTDWLLAVLADRAGRGLAVLCDELVATVAHHVEDDVALLALRSLADG